jgi:hypothetical protein
MSAFTWRIESGVLALSVVDPLEALYSPAWNAPAGKTSTTAVIADYEADSTFWSCQVTAGTLTPSADTTTQDLPATFCQKGATVPTPAQSTWTLDVEMLQDPHAGPTSPTMGLAEYTYLHDAEEVYFLLGLNGDTNPPRAIGRIRMSPTAFGGVAQEILTASVSWPVSQWPDIAWGQAVVLGTTASSSGGKKQTADAAA